MRRWSILIIEDHPPTIAALQRLLSLSGHVTVVARTLATARVLVEAQDFDLIISDVHLPDGESVSFMRELSKRKPVRAIAVSGSVSINPEDCHAAGFHECLQKPVEFETLQRAIERAMTDGSVALSVRDGSQTRSP